MGMSMEEFLGHSTRGGRGNVLKDWKDKGSILIWLNQKAGFHCLWRHSFKKIMQFKDKAPEIWGEKFLCEHSTGTDEDNEILANQYRRDKDTGVRLFPPSCGTCRFLEDIYQAVKSKDVSWTEPAFVFKTSKAQEIMHAGGLVGFFKNPKMSDEEKAELAEHGIFQKDAWKEDLRAKAEYLFCVADGNDPKSGLQVAIQPQSVGDKMKIEIRKQIKARGEKGDPTINPYPFLWEYDKNGSFDDAYTVTPMIEDKPSPQIMKLINSTPPDVSAWTTHTSKKLIRTMMEQFGVLDVGGWEQYFPVEAEADSKAGKEAPQERTPEVSTKAPAAAPAPSEDDDLVACDGCDKPMKATDTKCPHPGCGKVYVVETSAPPTPAPLKKRSEAKASAPAAAPAAAPAKAQTMPGIADAFAGPEGDVPF